MTDPFVITEKPKRLPPRIETVDLELVVSEQMVRIGKLTNELANVRARAEKAMRDFLRELLVVADALDRIEAIAPGPDANSTRAVAVVRTKKLLARTLATQGVVRPTLLGEIADPELVDIDRCEQDPSLPDETVVGQIVPAYTRNGTVLRPGVVVVSQRDAL